MAVCIKDEHNKIVLTRLMKTGEAKYSTNTEAYDIYHIIAMKYSVSTQISNENDT
jgi:hypothetical protein